MPQVLRQLRIDRVAHVDKGAGEGVRVLLMKRRGTEQSLAPPIEAYLKRNYLDERAAFALQSAPVGLSDVEKREFSSKERDAASKSGVALPDGSFPIENKSDLHNAMRAIGRAKDPGKAKAHIRSRAKALGLTGELSDAFKRAANRAGLLKFLKADDGIDATLFDDAHEQIEAREYAESMMDEICEAIEALNSSVCSILADDDCDKQAMLETTFDQFKEHMSGIVPEELEKAFIAAGIAAATNGGDPATISKGAAMTTVTLTAIAKALSLPEAASEVQIVEGIALLGKRAAKLEKKLRIAKMSASHKQYMSESGMDGDEKDKFQAMSPDERDGHIGKHPLSKRLPEHVQKQLAEAEQTRVALVKLQRKDRLGELAKRAVAAGLPESFGETILKALGEDLAETDVAKRATGQAEAVEALLKHIEGLNVQVKKGALFSEFGNTGGGGGAANGSAYEQLMQKARELAGNVNKSAKPGETLTVEQAFAKVYEDRANAELVATYKRESAPRPVAA